MSGFWSEGNRDPFGIGRDLCIIADRMGVRTPHTRRWPGRIAILDLPHSLLLLSHTPKARTEPQPLLPSHL